MFEIIYADPPWTYTDPANAGNRGAVHKYPLMSNYEIQRIPVEKIAAENSVCFLWVTAPLLLEGIDTLEAWGFKYITKAFTWVKTNKNGTIKLGMGHYTRANSEDVILGVRGKRLERADKSVSQIIIAPAEEHSKKPGEVRERINKLYPNTRKIELFSRTENPGWISLGYDINNKDIREEILQYITENPVR